MENLVAIKQNKKKNNRSDKPRRSREREGGMGEANDPVYTPAKDPKHVKSTTNMFISATLFEPHSFLLCCKTPLKPTKIDQFNEKGEVHLYSYSRSKTDKITLKTR